MRKFAFVAVFILALAAVAGAFMNLQLQPHAPPIHPAAAPTGQWSPASMIAAPGAPERKTRWLVASNGDTPLDPAYTAIACLAIAVTVPLIVLFGYMRSGQKEIAARSAELAKIKAANASRLSLSGGEAAKDPWGHVTGRG